MTEKRWYSKRENVYAFFGLVIISIEFVHAEFFNGVFHYEFLLLGAGLCGISIAQKGDKL